MWIEIVIFHLKSGLAKSIVMIAQQSYHVD